MDATNFVPGPFEGPQPTWVSVTLTVTDDWLSGLIKTLRSAWTALPPKYFDEANEEACLFLLDQWTTAHGAPAAAYGALVPQDPSDPSINSRWRDVLAYSYQAMFTEILSKPILHLPTTQTQELGHSHGQIDKFTVYFGNRITARYIEHDSLLIPIHLHRQADIQVHTMEYTTKHSNGYGSVRFWHDLGHFDFEATPKFLFVAAGTLLALTETNRPYLVLNGATMAAVYLVEQLCNQNHAFKSSPPAQLAQFLEGKWDAHKTAAVAKKQNEAKMAQS